MQMSTLERQVRLVEENERRGLGGGVDACKSPIRGFWGCYGPTDFFKCLQETKKVPVNASHVCLQPRGRAAELDRAKRHERRGRKRVWRTAMKAES